MLNIIKEAVKQTIEVEKMTDFTTAVVISEKPLKIEITKKLVLGINQLIISEKLTDRFVYMSAVEDDFENLQDQEKYKVRKKYIVYDGLKVGEKVVVARKVGGQQYFVIDRVGK